MTFCREETRTSRKRRVCQACRQHIEIGERYTQWAGENDGSFDTADFHPDCRATEVELNHAYDLQNEEWMSLRDLVSDSGKGILNCAPAAVRVRFRLPSEPEIAFEKWLDDLREVASSEVAIEPSKWRRDFVLGHAPRYAFELAIKAREKARQRAEERRKVLEDHIRAEGTGLALCDESL